nr:MAG TPA: hypothetical protein [Caudoviricetes sp.]
MGSDYITVYFNNRPSAFGGLNDCPLLYFL